LIFSLNVKENLLVLNDKVRRVGGADNQRTAEEKDSCSEGDRQTASQQLTVRKSPVTQSNSKEVGGIIRQGTAANLSRRNSL
jgi:hypothetical protein